MIDHKIGDRACNTTVVTDGISMTITVPALYVLDNEMNKNKNAASSTPPWRWAARCVVHLYSVDSPVALSRSDDEVRVT